MYVTHLGSKVERPIKELKGFQRVALKAGETKTVQFPLKAKDLAYWDAQKKQWVVEDEKVNLMVGASSADVRLQQRSAWGCRFGMATRNVNPTGRSLLPCALLSMKATPAALPRATHSTVSGRPLAFARSRVSRGPLWFLAPRRRRTAERVATPRPGLIAVTVVRYIGEQLEAHAGQIAIGRDKLLSSWDRYVGDDPERISEYEKCGADIEVAQLIYDLRTDAGLTQRQLANKVSPRLP